MTAKPFSTFSLIIPDTRRTELTAQLAVRPCCEGSQDVSEIPSTFSPCHPASIDFRWCQNNSERYNLVSQKSGIEYPFYFDKSKGPDRILAGVSIAHVAGEGWYNTYVQQTLGAGLPRPSLQRQAGLRGNKQYSWPLVGRTLVNRELERRVNKMLSTADSFHPSYTRRGLDDHPRGVWSDGWCAAKIRI